MRFTKHVFPRRHGFRAWFAAGLLAGAAALPAAAGDIAAGKAAAAVCVACHQADGGGMATPGVEPWPALAGLDAGYIVRQLQAFKSGGRGSISMQPFAMMLNDEQMQDVAAYYAALPPVPPKAPEGVDEALLRHGERLALRGDWERYIVACASCHGPGNNGVGGDFPRLTGQLPEYLRTQLLAYRDGSRANDPQDLMGTIARRMSDRDIEAVSAWLGAQRAARAGGQEG